MSEELSIYQSKILDILKSDTNKEMAKKMIDADVNHFFSAMLSLVANNNNLQKCTAQSIMGACMTIARLKLPFDPSLGRAYVVPYSGVAMPIIGSHGFRELALRSGEYVRLDVKDIRFGEVVTIDPIKDIYEFSAILDPEQREKSAVVGYYAVLELRNGFKKEVYWTLSKLLEHAKKYSKSFNTGAWKTAQDEMCKKTVIKHLIHKHGILSVEMQQAYVADNNKVEYDNEGNQFIEPTEYKVVEQTDDSAEKEFRRRKKDE